MKLIIEPAHGVAPLLAAIKGAKKSVEIAIFRFDRQDLETALKEAAARGVKVTALIAFANRGGEQSLRKLEMRCLAAGITVARTSDDLARYHGKYVIVDRRLLCVLSFNFTHLDVDHSRGFGIVTTHANWVREAVSLFQADCMRTTYAPKADTFVVSPTNSRKVLDTFLMRAKTELLIYDPRISDKGMLCTLQARARAGVVIKVIGSMTGPTAFDVQKLAGTRLHTRTIIRDRRQAFVGSQSLRTAELDARREVGLIVRDARVVAGLVGTFESDWVSKPVVSVAIRPEPDAPTVEAAAVEPEVISAQDAEKALVVLSKALDPLAVSVKKAVRIAVARAGGDALNDKAVKDTMKDVVKRAVKEAVKEATADAEAVKDAQAGT